MKALLIIIMLLMPMPCLAAAGDTVCSQGDRELLCEMMSFQARMGIVICGIASEWRLKGNEFMELGEFGPKLAGAVEAISGRLPEPVAIEAPNFTEKKEILLRKAAGILGEADKMALGIYEQEGARENSLSKLEDMENEIKRLLFEIAK